MARETGTLLAGDVCNTNVYLDDAATRRTVRAMFDEQVAWAAEAGVDFVIAETFQFAGEALLATEAIRAAGLRRSSRSPIHQRPAHARGLDAGGGVPRLADAGATVVGPQLHPRAAARCCRCSAAIRAAVDVPVAALPVPYRTHDARADVPVARTRRRPGTPFPIALDPFTCTRYDVAAFARDALALGVEYLGLCCGAAPHHIRAMAEAMGRRPPASRYSPDMSKHAYLGTDPSLQAENLAFAERL